MLLQAMDFLKNMANKSDDNDDKVFINVDELRHRLDEEQHWFLHVVKETEKFLLRLKEEEPDLFKISGT